MKLPNNFTANEELGILDIFLFEWYFQYYWWILRLTQKAFCCFIFQPSPHYTQLRIIFHLNAIAVSKQATNHCIYWARASFLLPVCKIFTFATGRKEGGRIVSRGFISQFNFRTNLFSINYAIVCDPYRIQHMQYNSLKIAIASIYWFCMSSCNSSCVPVLCTPYTASTMQRAWTHEILYCCFYFQRSFLFFFVFVLLHNEAELLFMPQSKRTNDTPGWEIEETNGVRKCLAKQRNFISNGDSNISGINKQTQKRTKVKGWARNAGETGEMKRKKNRNLRTVQVFCGVWNAEHTCTTQYTHKPLRIIVTLNKKCIRLRIEICIRHYYGVCRVLLK